MKFKKFNHKTDFYFKDNRIYLTDSGKAKAKKPKKITGTRLSSVLGIDKYNTPFQIWCDILGFIEPEKEDFFMKTGVVIEPKLKEFAEKHLNKKFVSYDAMSIGYDKFKDIPIFGGIPDGEEIEGSQVKTILEIKTAQIDKCKWAKKNNEFLLVKKDGLPIIDKFGGSLPKWFVNDKFVLPESYKYQLGLYLYLRKITTGYFCVCFLNMDDYLNPEKFSLDSTTYVYKDFDVGNETIKKIKTTFFKERVIIFQKLEINLEEFGKAVKNAENWYKNHIYEGVSPTLSKEDIEWFKYGFEDLEC